MQTKILSFGNSNKHSRKVALKPAQQTLSTGEGWFLRDIMCLLRNKNSKSKVLSGGFCLHDLGADE